MKNNKDLQQNMKNRATYMVMIEEVIEVIVEIVVEEVVEARNTNKSNSIQGIVILNNLITNQEHQGNLALRRPATLHQNM